MDLPTSFEMMRALPGALLEPAVSDVLRRVREHFDGAAEVLMAPLVSCPADLPPGWDALLTAEDPRPAIRHMLGARLGDPLARALSHIALVRTNEGPSIAYVCLGVEEHALVGQVLLGHPPAEDARADEALAGLLRVHGGLHDEDGCGVLPPGRWEADAGGELDVGDDEGLPEGCRVPYELVRMARPFAATDDDPDAVLGLDPKSDPPRTYTIIDGSLGVEPDVISDVEARLHYLAMRAMDVAAVAFEVRELDGKWAGGKARKTARKVGKLPVGALVLGRMDEDEDETAYVALLKVTPHAYRAFRAGSQEDALTGLAACGARTTEAEAKELLDAVRKVKHGRAEMGLPIEDRWAAAHPEKGIGKGDVAALAELLERGGDQRVPAGRYTLKRSLHVTGTLTLDAADTVLVAPKGKPALELDGEARVTIRGATIRAEKGTGIALTGTASLTLEGSVIIGSSDAEGHNGIHARGEARVVVHGCRFEGFHAALAIVDHASLEAVDVLCVAGQQGVCCEGSAQARLEKTVGVDQIQGHCVANGQSAIDVSASEAHRAHVVGFYADGTATLTARASASSDCFVGFYAGGSARLRLREVRTTGSADTGIKSMDEGNLEVEDATCLKDSWGVMSRASLSITRSLVAGSVKNAYLASGGRLEVHAGSSYASGDPAFGATGGGVLAMRDCTVFGAANGTGAVVRGEGSRCEAHDCRFEVCFDGVIAGERGAARVESCRFVRTHRHAFYIEPGGELEDSECSFESTVHEKRFLEPEKDDEDEDDDDDEDDEDDDEPEPASITGLSRMRLGEVRVPSGVVVLVDFGLMPEWRHGRHAKALRKKLGKGPVAEVDFGPSLALAMSGVDEEGTLTVYGTQMGEPPFEDCWRYVDLDVSGGAVASRVLAGHLVVERARFMFADLDALGEWREGESHDGKADLVFWGRDEIALAEASGATRLDDGRFGWLDLPVQEAKEREDALIAKVREHEWWVVGEVNEHDHHHAMLRSTGHGARAGELELGDALLCGLFTGWGDGVFPVWRELDADGTLVRVRVVLGTARTVANMRHVNAMD